MERCTPIYNEERIRKLIDDHMESIEREHANGSPWVACVGTRVYVMETCLTMADSDLQQRLQPRIEDLKWLLRELWDIYPNSDSEPSDKDRANVMRRLDIFAEPYYELSSTPPGV